LPKLNPKVQFNFVMKKLVLMVFTALFLVGMVACQQSNAPENADAGATPEVADVASAEGEAADPSATADSPKKPGYQEQAEAMPATTVEWSETEYDFGKVKDGDLVRHTYSFTNTGSNPLVLQRAKASCGCTTPNWTQEPIPPGGKGEVAVEFNSKNKPGMQTKTVTVTGNFEGGINQVLRIRGEVEPAAGE
jgi:hypothetical protein